MTKVPITYKSMNWFLYESDLRHERVNGFSVLNNLAKSFILAVGQGSEYASVMYYTFFISNGFCQFPLSVA